VRIEGRCRRPWAGIPRSETAVCFVIFLLFFFPCGDRELRETICIFFFFLFCGDKELKETKRKVDREETKNRSRGMRDAGNSIFSKGCWFNSNRHL
jgi:hypothetical protein